MNSEKMLPADYKSGSITVRKASISEFPALEKMLARAYDNDPGVNWVCLQDRHRTERITRFLSMGLHVARPFGEIYTTQDLTGAAAWIPPGKTGSVLTAITMGIGAAGIRHGVSVGIAAIILEKRHPKTPHWQLLEFGVEPSLQGKGIGCDLLQPILHRCDQDRIPAYVITYKERTPFYEHRGFKIRECVKLPFGSPDNYCMWREPR